jgi:hypothetical protein
MAGGRSADGRPRGGERIPKARSRARLTFGFAALAFAGAIGAYSALAASRLGPGVAVLGLAALFVLAAGIWLGVPAAVAVSVAGLGTAWAVSAWTRGADAPAGTMLVAGAVVALAELAFAALDQVPVADEEELIARRLAGVAARAAGAIVLAALLLTALGLHASGGLALEAVGIAAAVALLALLFLLAREQPQPER